MKYIELLSKVENDGNFLKINLNCCDPEKDNFSLVMAQLRGRLTHSEDEGVQAEDMVYHDQKCQSLITLSKKEGIDLLLFPEYCISYNLMQKIISTQELWPDNRKLWCLPCQGIPNQEFEDFLDQCRKDRQVFLSEDAWEDHLIDRKQFVNALFYLFVAYDSNNPKIRKLCIAFQIKTQHMADGTCECEVPGLTTGSVIYHLNNRLITLLCADSLNNKIVWQDLQNKELSQCIILHPQLNESPRNSDFRRVREEMIRHNEGSCYISCNWAENTVISGLKNNSAGQQHSINLSWSCIYRKFPGRGGFSEWAANKELRSKNSKYGLFGGYMKNANTEVWFGPSEEHALLLHIPSVNTRSYGIVSIKNVCAKKRFYPNIQEAVEWTAIPFSYSLQSRLEQTEDEYLKQRIQSIEEPYQYPLTETDKYKTDHFLSLALADFPSEILELNENEEPAAWTLLFEDKDIEDADFALKKLQCLIEFFKKQCFPKNMELFNRERRFTFIPSDGDKPNANMTARDRHIIVAYADSRRAADKHVQFLLEHECHNSKDLLKDWVCVLCQEPGEPIESRPILSTDIGRGEPVLMRGEVTDGDDGNE